MVKRTTVHFIVYLSVGVLWLHAAVNAQNTLQLFPKNHHYLEYQKKPVLLITSGEHYGVLLNLDVDYIVYLDALHKEGMNNTRVFSGAYVERRSDIDFMQYGNTLAPRPGRLITPWKRSRVPGYPNGGTKFDLDQWNEQYFTRLKSLLTQAGRRGIMVEFTLFGNQYGDSIYSYSPLYEDNNIQHVGKKGKDRFLDFQTLKDTALLARQDAMVTKIVREVNDFDNIYFEISNEPYNYVKDSSLIDRWHEHLVTVIRKAESPLPKKHLIAANQAIVDNPEVDIANYHYVHISNMPDFDSLLHLNKVISMNETMGSLHDADVNDIRVEAWDFILHGGGAYNNLSWEYTPTHPQGTPGADTIRHYLQNLQHFMDMFQYTRMKYRPTILLHSPKTAITRVLADEGKQYLLYIHHSEPHESLPDKKDFVSKYEAQTAIFRDTLSLSLPPGNYDVHWYNPSLGQWTKPAVTRSSNGTLTLYTPAFTTDIAISIAKK